MTAAGILSEKVREKGCSSTLFFLFASSSLLYFLSHVWVHACCSRVHTIKPETDVPECQHVNPETLFSQPLLLFVHDCDDADRLVR